MLTGTRLPLCALAVALASSPAGATAIRSIAVTGVTLDPARGAELGEVLSPFVGQENDATSAERLQRSVRLYFDSIGRPFVRVDPVTPAAGSDELTVRVTEPRLGSVWVEGNRWFAADQYRRAVRLRPGEPLDETRLLADMDWIGLNPDRKATASVSQGSGPDAVDVVVHAQDHFPLDLSVQADNAGPRETGLYRLGAAADWTNAFWRGDVLSYQFMTSPDLYRLRDHALTYTTWLPWRDTFTLAASVTLTHGLGAPAGRTVIASPRYTVSLPDTARFHQQIDLGFDFKSTDTNVTSGGTSVFPVTTEVMQFAAEYGAQLTDSLGITGISLAAVFSPGGWSGGNSTAFFQVQQPGATAHYIYGRLTLERLTQLPRDVTWDVRVISQLSSAILLPSEQLVLAGTQSVRGFEEYGTLRDSGVVAQTELRAPPFSAGRNDTVMPFVFIDAGTGRNHNEVAGLATSAASLVSAGPGVTVRLGGVAMLRFSWGFPLVRSGSLGALLGPQFLTRMSF